MENKTQPHIEDEILAELIEEIDTTNDIINNVEETPQNPYFFHSLLSSPDYLLIDEIFINRQSEEEEFQKLLFNLLGGVFGENAGSNNTDAAQFMKDFQSGFASGYTASEQYSQQQSTVNEEALGFFPSFVFKSNKTFPLFVTCTGTGLLSFLVFFLCLGWRFAKVSLAFILSLCVCRLGFIFLIASPSQVASLSYILSSSFHEIFMKFSL